MSAGGGGATRAGGAGGAGSFARATVELSAGPIGYLDTGGEGPVIVMIPGLVMDDGHWIDVGARLADGFRCVLPTMPFGAHRAPMKADADLSLTGMARIVAEFLEALSLTDVTLCFNDWGGAPPMIGAALMGRVGRLVLVSCEAFDNYPPGLPGKMAALSGWLPGGLSMLRMVLPVRRMRQLPVAFGWMAKHGIPDDRAKAWAVGLRDPGVRRDVRKYIRAAGPLWKNLTGRGDYGAQVSALDGALRDFERPVLIVWAREDRMMPLAHAHRLGELFPDSRVVEIEDSYTLVPLDQPDRLAAELRTFAGSGAASPGSSPASSAASASIGVTMGR